MAQLALSESFKYICYGSAAIRNMLIFSARDRLYTSGSDVYRRQILTYKDGPRTERVKPLSYRYAYLTLFLPSTTIIVFNVFYLPTKSMILRVK